MAFEKGNEEIINLVLSAEGLQLDVDHLKSQKVFAKAVTACQKYVFKKMGDDGIFDKEMITLFALENDMDEFAKILGMRLIINPTGLTLTLVAWCQKYNKLLFNVIYHNCSQGLD